VNWVNGWRARARSDCLAGEVSMAKFVRNKGNVFLFLSPSSCGAQAARRSACIRSLYGYSICQSRDDLYNYQGHTVIIHCRGASPPDNLTVQIYGCVWRDREMVSRRRFSRAPLPNRANEPSCREIRIGPSTKGKETAVLVPPLITKSWRTRSLRGRREGGRAD
jgi:hypothetical protein